MVLHPLGRGQGIRHLTAACAAQDTGDRVADWTPPAVEAGVAIPGEEVLLDGNVEAEGKPFFAVGGSAVTIDGTLYAYAVDNAGDERFTLRIKDLRTGELLPDVIENVFYGVSFSPDGTRIFYTVVDDSWRPYQVKSHVLGTPVTEDEVIYQEDDVAMWLGFELSADRRHLVLSIGCSEFSETRLLRFDDPDAGLAHRDFPRRNASCTRPSRSCWRTPRASRERILLTHNRDAINSMVSLVDPAELAKPLAEQHWATVVAHSDHVRVNGAGVTSTHAGGLGPQGHHRTGAGPAAGRAGHPGAGRPRGAGLRRGAVHRRRRGLRLRGPRDPDGLHLLLHPVPGVRLRAAHGGACPAVNCCCARKARCWAATPPSDYVATREWATAADGTRIPLSVLRHASVARDSTAAGLVYGYGSYELSMDPGFGIPRLSLLDRGIVFVIAHIRGGGELGRHWYDDGKKLHKKNTFTDFIAATDWLAQSGWVDPARIAAMGGSAGGLLMGAVANLAPEKYAAIVAAVPFVDALTTILDPELPLSALEWEEWGNPITDPDGVRVHEVVHAVRERPAVAYPKIAAVTSFNDTRVLYVEPAKWVQRLREVTTGSEPIVMKIEMDGGHGGASGRYVQWKERAWDYAFVADSLGATELLPGAGLK